MPRIRSVMPFVCLVTAAACIDRPVTSVEPEPFKEEKTEFPLQINRDLDLLFVIDNSRSMTPEQDSLAVNFYRLINALETLEGGLPNLHIGVISTDMGAGDSCITNDGGRLQATPRVDGCSPPDGNFISDIGGVRNYSGTLADTFSCIARLGPNGCGFEQTLASVRAALDGSNPGNDGFLRDNAMLGIVFITDEDDCSTFDPAMFTTVDDPSSTIGALSSFRCFEFGVECEGSADPRAPGSRENCRPRADSPYMDDVDEFVSFVRGLKQFESQVLVAAITGNPTPVRVTTDDRNYPCLDYSCGSAPVCGDPGTLPAAVPAIRLQAFLDTFASSTLTTICNDDLSDALDRIASFFARALKGGCIVGPVADLDPATDGVQPDCAVTEIRDPLGERIEQVLPACDDPVDPQSSSNLPCWRVIENLDKCTDTAQHLEIEVFYPDGASVPPDTRIDARCVGE